MKAAYADVLDELASRKYLTWSVGDWFFSGMPEVDGVVNVPLRVDCDFDPGSCLSLAGKLSELGLNASFFFLRDTPRELVDEVKEMGFEVGLHSDHATRELDLFVIKDDAERLGVECVTHHGYLENWYLYRDVSPFMLGLRWHDGCSEYADNDFRDLGLWRPPTDKHLTDHMILNNGWNKAPWYPLWVLRNTKQGESLHVVMHTHFHEYEPRYQLMEWFHRPFVANVYAAKKRWLG